MSKLTLLEIFVRGVPEAFLFVVAVYAFSKKAIDVKRYLLSCVVLSITGYVIRLLPIHYGANIMLNLILFIVVTVNLNKIDIIKAIQANITAMILEFICEGINVMIIQFVFNANIKYIFNDPTMKIVYGIPSLLIFGCIVSLYYFILWKRKELKDVSYGEIE